MMVSGLEWKIISPCAKWMEPYFQIIKEETPPIFLLEQNEQIESKFGVGHISPNIVTDDSHIIQTHSTSLELFVNIGIILKFYLKCNNIFYLG